MAALQRSQRWWKWIPDNETDSSTVLVVEDEQPLADLYASWLTETYSVRTAYDGEQALEQLDDDVAVVLLDRRMPHSSGDRVLEEIRERDYACRVAMVTGVNPDFEIIEMRFDEYLTKPVSKADLQEVVDHLLTKLTYNRQLQEYFALVSKIAALEAEKTRADLRANEEYLAMKERAATERERLDALFDDVDVEEMQALFRG